MGEILRIAEALWARETDTYTHHPFGPPYGLEQVAKGVHFVKGFANAIVVETSEGLIIVDPGGNVDAQAKYAGIRKVLGARLRTAIYTHGHVDHIFGVPLFLAEGQGNVQVISHERLIDRLRRYIKTDGWNSVINTRQFRGGAETVPWPLEYHEPDVTYSHRLDLTVGGQEIQIRHCRGETDDHSWIYFPGPRVLCTGDLFIYAVPNAGNPQKVQRYAADWARGLCEMAALEPEILLPGHGFPVVGRDRVREALLNTARMLDHLDQRTIELMNQGASLDRIIHEISAPEDLVECPYLQPVYDEPEFIVRNIYRLYGGWYDGIPSHLKPASEAEQAAEIASLAGGADKLAARAEMLSADGNHRMACHLADWAVMADDGNPQIRAMAGRIYMARARVEPSTMALGIYMTAARSFGAPIEGERLKKGQLIMAQAERGRFRHVSGVFLS